MMIKCPVCKERHVVPDNYDNTEYICLNSDNRRTPKTFQNVEPEDLFTRNNPLMNRRSTKVDEKRAVIINISGPYYRPDGERIGPVRKKNY